MIKFVGLFFIFIGICAYFGIEIPDKFNGTIIPNRDATIIYVIIGFIFIFLGTKYKIKYPEFTKCPKCKKSYNYGDTIKGKCPKCNIDTIEIEKYYKQFPSELEKLETDIKGNKND